MTANLPDDEARSERLSMDHGTDRPDLADVIDIHTIPRPGRTCVAAWVRHETRADFMACPSCMRSAP